MSAGSAFERGPNGFSPERAEGGLLETRQAVMDERAYYDALTEAVAEARRLTYPDARPTQADERDLGRNSGQRVPVSEPAPIVRPAQIEVFSAVKVIEPEEMLSVLKEEPGTKAFARLAQTVKDKFPLIKADAKRRIAFVINNQGQRVAVDITTGENLLESAIDFTICVDKDGASNFRQFLAKENPTSDMLSVLSTDDNAVNRIHARATAVNGELQLTASFGVYDVYSKNEMQDGEAQTMTPEAFATFFGALQRPESESEESRGRRHDEEARVDQMRGGIDKRQKNDIARHEGKGHRPFVAPMAYVGVGGSLLNPDGTSPVWQPGQLRGKAEYDARKNKKATGKNGK